MLWLTFMSTNCTDISFAFIYARLLSFCGPGTITWFGVKLHLCYLLFFSSNKHQQSCVLRVYYHLWFITHTLGSLTRKCACTTRHGLLSHLFYPYTLWMAYETVHDIACRNSQTCDLWFPVGSFQSPMDYEFILVCFFCFSNTLLYVGRICMPGHIDAYINT